MTAQELKLGNEVLVPWNVITRRPTGGGGPTVRMEIVEIWADQKTATVAYCQGPLMGVTTDVPLASCKKIDED
jgi:hypothetical protein